MSALRNLLTTNTTNGKTTGGPRLPRYRMAAAGLAVAAVSLLGACSAESLIESGIEKGIEKGIESGTDVEDFNLGEDGGSISFESDGEQVELDFGADGGSIKVTDAEGNESGLDLDVNEEGGSLTVTENGESETFDGTVTDNGLVVTDESGQDVINIETSEDGSADLELPEWYPSNVPVPADYAVADAYLLGDDGIVGGFTPEDPTAAEVRFVAAAEANGWSVINTVRVDAGNSRLTFTNPLDSIIIVSFTLDGAEDGQTRVNFALMDIK